MRLGTAILAVSLLLTTAGPVGACIWDSDTDRSEREFRSSYREQPVEAPAPSPSLSDQPGPIAMLGAGSALLLGACVLSVRRSRKAD
jgi:hypothetical protein